MPLIPDFKILDKNLQGFLISLFSIPFWYISFYLFHYNFFAKSDLILLFSFCFTLNLISYSIGLAIYIYHIVIFKKPPKDSNIQASFWVTLITVFYFSIIIVLCYYRSFNFITLLKIYFIPCSSILVIIALISFFIPKKKT